MNAKMLEVRDGEDLIAPICAVRPQWTTQREKDFLGYACGLIPTDLVVMDLFTFRVKADYDDWGDRGMAKAHKWLSEHYEEVADGSVIDIAYIYDGAVAPAKSEIWE